MSDLEGKVVIITGVGRPRGVGRAAALRYAEKGAKREQVPSLPLSKQKLLPLLTLRLVPQ